MCFSYFVLVLFAFVVLGFVSSVLNQETGSEERLQNDLFCVEWDAKPSLSQSVCCLLYLHADAVHVREEHRIVGTLVGCLPRLPRQNVQLGLPLQLSAYEAKLLLEKGGENFSYSLSYYGRPT